MKRTHRLTKILALLLATIMTLGALPVAAAAVAMNPVEEGFPAQYVSSASYSAGDTFALGSYPQTRVSDTATLNALNILRNDDSSVEYNGSFYVYKSATQWYKVEPIEWLVISNNTDENSVFVVSSNILDTRSFGSSSWSSSSLRTWLNGTFLSSAFTSAEKELIYTSDGDSLFLLSSSEASSGIFSDRSDRLAVGTNYAADSGLSSSDGYGRWWLKNSLLSTPGHITSDGYPNYLHSSSSSDIGVRPAMRVNITSADSVEISKTEASLIAGQSLSLMAAVTPTQTTFNEIVWSSSNRSVATVDQNGLVTAVSAGTANITVTSADDKTKFTTCVLTVIPITLTELTILTEPVDLEYFEGETLDADGMTLRAVYNNGDVATITDDDVVCSPTLLEAPGKQEISVSYDGGVASFFVNVTAIVPASIEVVKTPDKVEYFEGDIFDAEGLAVLLTYNNGDIATLTDDDVAVSTPTDFNLPGIKTINVSYASCTDDFDVLVRKIELEEISIIKAPDKLDYFDGDALDTTGLLVKGIYNNGDIATFTDDDVVCSPSIVSTGEQLITVERDGKTTNFTANVEAVVLISLTVKTLPKLNYFVGDTLNTAGLTLTASYNNGAISTVTSGFVCSPTVFTDAGTKTVTVSWGGKSTSFNVNVTPVLLIGIAVKTLPNKAEYVVGESLSVSGLTLTAAYNSGKIDTVTSGFVCSPESAFSSLGEKTITVTWGGFETSFTVNVTRLLVSKLEMSRSSVELRYKNSLTLSATAYPNGATDSSVTWSSSDESIATVNAAGEVTTIRPGTVTITATANDGGGAKATCSVKVYYAWWQWIIRILLLGWLWY